MFPYPRPNEVFPLLPRSPHPLESCIRYGLSANSVGQRGAGDGSCGLLYSLYSLGLVFLAVGAGLGFAVWSRGEWRYDVRLSLAGAPAKR